MKTYSFPVLLLGLGLMMGCASDKCGLNSVTLASSIKCEVSKLDMIAHCDDVAVLEEIAINARPSGCHKYVENMVYVGIEAVKQIKNIAALEKIQSSAKSPAVREAAAERLAAHEVVTDEDALVDTAINACPSGAHGYAVNTVYFGIAAIERLKELGATNSLVKVSANAIVPALRETAMK